MNNNISKKIFLSSIIFSILMTGIVLGFLIRPHQMVYISRNDNYLSFDEKPICEKCHFNQNNNNIVFVGQAYQINLVNLTINRTFIIILPERAILFIANKNNQTFYYQFLDSERSEFRFTLLELHSNPYFIELDRIYDNIRVLDFYIVQIIDVSV